MRRGELEFDSVGISSTKSKRGGSGKKQNGDAGNSMQPLSRPSQKKSDVIDDRLTTAPPNVMSKYSPPSSPSSSGPDSNIVSRVTKDFGFFNFDSSGSNHSFHPSPPASGSLTPQGPSPSPSSLMALAAGLIPPATAPAPSPQGRTYTRPNYKHVKLEKLSSRPTTTTDSLSLSNSFLSSPPASRGARFAIPSADMYDHEQPNSGRQNNSSRISQTSKHTTTPSYSNSYNSSTNNRPTVSGMGGFSVEGHSARLDNARPSQAQASRYQQSKPKELEWGTDKTVLSDSKFSVTLSNRPSSRGKHSSQPSFGTNDSDSDDESHEVKLSDIDNRRLPQTNSTSHSFAPSSLPNTTPFRRGFAEETVRRAGAASPSSSRNSVVHDPHTDSTGSIHSSINDLNSISSPNPSPTMPDQNRFLPDRSYNKSVSSIGSGLEDSSEELESTNVSPPVLQRPVSLTKHLQTSGNNISYSPSSQSQTARRRLAAGVKSNEPITALAFGSSPSTSSPTPVRVTSLSHRYTGSNTSNSEDTRPSPRAMAVPQRVTAAAPNPRAKSSYSVHSDRLSAHAEPPLDPLSTSHPFRSQQPQHPLVAAVANGNTASKPRIRSAQVSREFGIRPPSRQKPPQDALHLDTSHSTSNTPAPHSNPFPAFWSRDLMATNRDSSSPVQNMHNINNLLQLAAEHTREVRKGASAGRTRFTQRSPSPTSQPLQNGSAFNFYQYKS